MKRVPKTDNRSLKTLRKSIEKMRKQVAMAVSKQKESEA